ncbi:MAG: sulfotransferase [Planctomycetota bacterium]
MKSDKSGSGFHHYPFYAPRFWHGMRPVTWWKLLSQLRFKVTFSSLPLLVGVSVATPFNTAMAWMQALLFGKRIRETQLAGAPVFIVGHWRSGTTMLHELLSLDERFGSPTTYQCFAPSHFLVSQWFFRRFATWLLPGRRPMDNMAAGWDRPQEDEFALMNLGLPSPYRRIAMPIDPRVDIEYLDLCSDSISDDDRESWLAGLRKFLQTVTVSCGRPLIIKSPTHTGRVGFLADAFSGSKFIHITRDPRTLYASTLRLWKSLDEVQSVTHTNHESLPNYVISCFDQMYKGFDRDFANIDRQRIIEIRYEDLVSDPANTLRRVYEELALGDFSHIQEPLLHWVETVHRGYQSNRHELESEDRERVETNMASYIQRYGYERD